MRYVSPIIISELGCLIAALFLVWKDKSIFWKIITCYIAVALATELFAIYLASHHRHNLWLFNIFIIFESTTILYGLYCCLREYTNPKPIFLIGSGMVYLTYFYFLISQPFTDTNALTISVMSIIFTLYCLYYYYLLLKDANFINIKTHPEFWWITGVLFYYFGSTMSNIFDGLFTVKIIGNATLRYCIYVLLNLILYSFWVYSFICRMKQRKLQS
jgi:hypothetical protein